MKTNQDYNSGLVFQHYHDKSRPIKDEETYLKRVNYRMASRCHVFQAGPHLLTHDDEGNDLWLAKEKFGNPDKMGVKTTLKSPRWR